MHELLWIECMSTTLRYSRMHELLWIECMSTTLRYSRMHELLWIECISTTLRYSRMHELLWIQYMATTLRYSRMHELLWIQYMSKSFICIEYIYRYSYGNVSSKVKRRLACNAAMLVCCLLRVSSRRSTNITPTSKSLVFCCLTSPTVQHN
jgi:hypothetical protein